MRVSFDEVKIYGMRSGKCAKCSKSVRRKRKFFQTMNPWNKNTDGFPKDRDDIMKELRQEVKDWEQEPIFHANCED